MSLFRDSPDCDSSGSEILNSCGAPASNPYSANTHSVPTVWQAGQEVPACCLGGEQGESAPLYCLVVKTDIEQVITQLIVYYSFLGKVPGCQEGINESASPVQDGQGRLLRKNVKSEANA